MTRIIPRELIKHLEWVPGQQPPERPVVTPAPQPVLQKSLSIDALINNGKEFYSEKKDRNGTYIGVAVALQKAVDNIGQEGIIATMPYLIAGKANADKDNYLRKAWHTALSEEDAGIDKNGKLVRKGESVVLTVHGGGILTGDRIRQAYSEGLTPQNVAKLR